MLVVLLLLLLPAELLLLLEAALLALLALQLLLLHPLPLLLCVATSLRQLCHRRVKMTSTCALGSRVQADRGTKTNVPHFR